MRLLILVCFLIISGSVYPAYAQDSGYAPPPMFGTAPVPTPTTPSQPIKKKRPKPVTEHPEPIAPVTKQAAPKTPVASTGAIPVPQPKPKTEEPSPSVAQPTPTKAQEPTGVVRGPKTMPAVQKERVQAIVTFDDETTKPANLIDRAQKAAKETIKQPKPIRPRTEEKVEALTTDSKITLLFIKKQRAVTPLHKKLLKPVLAKPENLQNIYIEAYARDGNAASLERAFHIREYLIENGILPQVINLRANGNNTQTIPLDRVDIAIHVDKTLPITQ